MSYKHYHITLSNAVDSYTFIYELAAHRPAQEWARQMASVSVESLRKTFDPWMGIHDLSEDKINRLHGQINQLFDRNDPKIAFGYIPIGKLVSVDDNIMPDEKVIEIVRNTNQILDWKIT